MLYFHFHCYFCKEYIYFVSHGVCGFCQNNFFKLPPCCPVCGLPAMSDADICQQCKELPPPWHRLIAVGDYQKPLKQMVIDLKFHKKIALAPVLARLLLLRWLTLRRRFGLSRPDILVSVPLHRYRYWQRGFNQTELMAIHLSRWLACDYDCTSVIRVRKTQPQQNLNAFERELNVSNAFELHTYVKDKHVVLLDDIVTTGNTVAEISRLLLSAGAKRIEVWCICRTLL